MRPAGAGIIGLRVRAWTACAALTGALLAGCDLDLGPIGGSNDGGQGTISGQVTDVANSSNVTNASISIRGAESHNILSTTGYYSIGGLLPGSYTVTVIPPSGYELAPNTMGTAPVQIVASEVKTVNFVLRRVVTTTSVPPQARD